MEVESLMGPNNQTTGGKIGVDDAPRVLGMTGLTLSQR
jgi:hypothetical protein